MIASKKPMLSEYGTLCTGESNWPVFTSHVTISYTTAVFPKGKEVFECKFYSILSPPQKLITCSFTWLKILQPITTVTF